MNSFAIAERFDSRVPLHMGFAESGWTPRFPMESRMDAAVESPLQGMDARDSLLEHLVERIPSLVFRARWTPRTPFEPGYLSPSAREILGVDASDAIAEPGLIWQSFAPSQRMRLWRAALRAHRGGTHLHLQLTLQIDGQAKEIEVHAERQGAADDASGWSGHVSDVTVHSHYHQALEAAYRAERADKAKAELMGCVAHELRTPLNAVLGFAHLLRSDAASHISQKQSEQLAQIERSALHLNFLISDLLDLARIDEGMLRLSPCPVPLQDVAREVVEMLQPAAADAGVCVRVGEPPMRLCAWADKIRLRQVLINLVSNAIKYNRPGGEVQIDWQLDPASTPQQVQVRVSDSGIGLTQEQGRRLFVPFDRLGAEHSGIDGQGIGLVITKRLVEIMAGQLTLVSTPGRGSTFTVRLPHCA